MTPPGARRAFLRAARAIRASAGGRSAPWAAAGPPTTVLRLPLALTLLATVAGCGAGEGAAGEAAPPLPAVEALQARRGALPLEERLHGVVKAANQVALHAEISAPVEAVLVATGEAVEKGQPLVRLRDDALHQQLRRAEADLRLEEANAAAAAARVAELEAQVVRSRALREEDLVSALDLETLEARYAAAEAGAEQAAARVEQARSTVDERRSDLAKTVVRAPAAGRVGQRRAEVGMLVDPDTPLFLLGDLSTLRVEVPLTESMLAYLRAGQPVRIRAAGLDEPLAAELSRVSPFLDEGSFSTVGEIDVANPEGRLQPGAFVTVDVLYGESDEATLVPASALWEDPRSGIRGVWVVGLDGAPPPAGELSAEPFPLRFRPVDVVAEGRAATGVAGVEAGQWVVTLGQHLLGGADGGAAASADGDGEARGEEDGGGEGTGAAGSGTARARVRAIGWDRVLELQGLQREDLLAGFLAEQRRLAAERGAVPPSSAEFLGQRDRLPDDDVNGDAGSAPAPGEG